MFANQLKNRVRETAKCDLLLTNGESNDFLQTRYSVWVSYAEVYNEAVHDLLEKVPEPK